MSKHLILNTEVRNCVECLLSSFNEEGDWNCNHELNKGTILNTDSLAFTSYDYIDKSCPLNDYNKPLLNDYCGKRIDKTI